MTFGLTIEKLLLIGVIAAMVIGPERLPAFAERFAQLTRSAGRSVRALRARVENETDIDFEDWKKLDPRQYDPRRIMRDVLKDDPPTP